MSGPEMSVPQYVYTAAKAVAATLGTAAGLAELAIADLSDGSVSLTEGIGFVTAAVTAAGTVYAVWKTTNKKVVKVG